MKQQLNVGQILTELNQHPSELFVKFDFLGFNPNGLDSYRGDYSHLALNFDDMYTEPTVGMLIACFKDAIKDTVTFTGYKGGEYKMTEKTPVWVAKPGCTNDNTAIHKVKRDGDHIILKTFQVKD